ncbi:MAG: AsnC family transcriptional regulator [Desulfovibrionaceae bacterium]
MDDYDRKILNIIQSDYPIASRPYAVVGDKVGLSEGEVLARVNALRDAGVIRRIGANFNSPQLGWHSTLCAAKVPEDKLDEFVAEVNRHDNVTHNYLRAHEFNVWFTYIGESPEVVRRALDEISEKTGIKILYLPADKLFKIKVDFNVEKDEA